MKIGYKHSYIEYKKIILFSLISFIVGIIFFGIYKEYIIIRYTRSTLSHSTQHHDATKKTATLTFWHMQKWQTETHEILWTDSKAENLRVLITCWLELLAEEQVLNKKIMVQATLLAPSNCDAFISLNANPLPNNGPIINKLYMIEGLLKTIRENDLHLQTVHFLVDHQPMIDSHLDFTNPWPTSGFLSIN